VERPVTPRVFVTAGRASGASAIVRARINPVIMSTL